MELRLLGPVQLWSQGRRVDLGVRRQRFLLAVLALEVNQVVPAERLIELIWADPPASARHAVQVAVSRLRATLQQAGAQRHGVRLATEGRGYALRASPGLVDASRFRALLDQARQSTDDQRKVALLHEALALWAGPALAGACPEEVRVRLCQGLEEARLAAAEDRLDAELRLGRHRALVEELTQLVAEHPQRQRLTAQLMLALYRSGRAADALTVYQHARRRLADELGLDPPAELAQLELAILRNAPEPTAVPPPAPTREPEPAPPPPAQLPADLATFTGRGRELTELLSLIPPDGTGTPVAVVISAIDGMAGIGKPTPGQRYKLCTVPLT